jgi:lactoylglutathione lyase
LPVDISFRYTIIYVPDVAASLDFYGRAFGFETRFTDPSGDYGELVTGDTTLAFVAESLATSNIGPFRRNRPDTEPAAIEVALITADVAGAVDAALAAGATPLTDPEEKPWGQVVAYVRDPNGVLVEIGSDVH